MKALDAIIAIINKSEMSAREISRSIGRHPNFVTNTLARGSVPKADTLAMIADACRYDLVLVSRDDDDDLTISPPGKDDDLTIS